jgi:hypothetical protein
MTELVKNIDASLEPLHYTYIERQFGGKAIGHLILIRSHSKDEDVGKMLQA